MQRYYFFCIYANNNVENESFLLKICIYQRVFVPLQSKKINLMIRKLLILFIAVLLSSAIFAQQDTTNNILPEELTADSITSDSGSYNDTVYTLYSTPSHYRSHRHWQRDRFKTQHSLQKKAVKRRHKAAVKKAKQKRKERMANIHKRAKSHSAHRSSSHSNHSSHSSHSGHSTHSTSHRSGHSRRRR